MTIRRLFMTAGLLAGLAVTALGDETKLLLIRAGAPAGVTVLDAGTTTATQTVIPRYRTGTSFPAGQLIGWGPASVIAATAATDDITPSSNRAVVITEDYGQAMSQWQNTTPGRVAAVLQPRLADLTVIGYSSNDWAILGNTVNDQPEIFNQEDEDLYAGFKGQAGGGIVENVTFFGIPGTACDIIRNGSALTAAPQQPFDRVKWNVNKLNIRRVFRGVYMNATDSHLTDVEVESFRDYGVRLGTNQTTGAIQFARLHCYGGGMSAVDNTTLAETDESAGTAGIDSPAIWIDGDTCHGMDCYGENAPVGLFIKGSYAALDGFYSHTCAVANVVFAGAHGHVSKARLDATATGAKFTNHYNTLSDSTIKVVGTTCNGIVVTNGTNQVIRDVVIDAYDNIVSVATTAASGTGSVVTLTFATQATIPFPVGTVITVAGVTPTGYNGTFTSTGGTTSTVTYASTQTGAQTIAGTVATPVGTGIAAQATLTKCRISATIVGGSKGIDFTGGGIGANNVIHVNTANGTLGAVTTPATLPSGWQSTTEVPSDTNQVYINGIRYYPAP